MQVRSTHRWLSVCLLFACQGISLAQTPSRVPNRNPPTRNKPQPMREKPQASTTSKPAVADLTIEKLTAGNVEIDGDRIRIPLSFVVRNEGTKTNHDCVVGVNYRSASALNPGRLLVNNSEAKIREIVPGGSTQVRCLFETIDGKLEGQQIDLTVKVDPENEVRESDKGNNTATTRVTIPKSSPAILPGKVIDLKKPESKRPESKRPSGFPERLPSNETKGTRKPNLGNDRSSKQGLIVGEIESEQDDSPDRLADNHQLPSVLRGNDGSAWYLRKEQAKVYLFGEHPGKKYATIFEGTLSNNVINGQYWDCPKGERTLKGNLALRLEERGDKLVVQSKSGGIDLSELKSYAIENGQLPTAYRKPGFGSNSQEDLDGAWRSGDMNFYVREVDNRIVGWVEQTFATGQKPVVARIAMGSRQADGRVAIQLISLPKGQATVPASETYVQDDAFHLRRLGGWTWVRDSMDVEKFGDEIRKRFNEKCVGFGYAIAHEGKVVKTGGGGVRALAGDGVSLRFDADTQKDTQSTAKTITAVAVLHLLEAKGMSVDDRIISWLPKKWKKGPMTESLTFKNLLTHKSGLVGYGDPDEYESLKKTIETGPVNMSWASPVYEYQNCNLAMFRIIIPYLENKSEMLSFEDNGVSGVTLNERCSERYIKYVRDNVLLPAGLENPQPTYTSKNIAYSYNFEKQKVAGYPQQDNQRWETGAGGWIVSARDYVKFLAALENGKIIPKNRVSELKSSRLGIFATSSAIGNAYYHGGSIGGNKSDSYGSGRGARAYSMLFPNNVQVYITINSANNLEPAESSGGIGNALLSAFQEALY